MPGASTTHPRPPPSALQPLSASASKALSHSAPASPLYPPGGSFAQAQLRPARAAGGGPSARRSWVDETAKSRESMPRASLRAVGVEPPIERGGRWDDARAHPSTRTMSSHSSDSSTSDRSGSSLRAEALSISSVSSSSTAIVTPRTSSLGSDDLEFKAPSPLSLPPLLPSKSERKKNGLGGVIKGWFGGSSSGAAKSKKKEPSPAAPRERQASTDSAMSAFEAVSPPQTPVDGPGTRTSTLGLSLRRSQDSSQRVSPRREPSSQQRPTARESFNATGAVPTPSFGAQPPPPTIPVAAPQLSRSRTSSSSALPQMTRTPPSLTPLQSLHLLSAQKLSIMFRPSPHPLFLSRSALTGLGQRPMPGLGGPAGASPSNPGRRFPASTNPLTRRNQQRYLGLAAEAGIRTLMRKLEEGIVANPDEVEGLIRLFAARPIALVRDKTGRFVATISDPADLDASLVDALAPTLPPAKSVAAGQLGSGILAFIRRPAYETRHSETLPHPQVPDRTFSFDVIRPRQRKVSSSSGGPRRESSLRFSTGLTSLAAEVESGLVFRTLAAKSPSATTTLLPTISTGRTSPTDMALQERTDALVVDAALAPIPAPAAQPSASTVPAVAPTAPATTKSQPARSSTMPPPSFKLSSASPSARPGPSAVATAQPGRPALTVPGLSRNGTVTRRSASFSGLETHLESSASSSAVEDEDEDEDALPLSVVARRQSFATLTSARASSTTPTAAVTPAVATSTPARAPRGVRFSVDTDALVRATDERLAAEAKAEKERLRNEELARKREQAHRAEIAATRERRESNKVGGPKKGNGGQFEDWSSLGSRAGAPTTIPTKASMRDLALPPAPVPAAAAIPAPSSFPRSRSSRQFASETMSRSPSSDRLHPSNAHRSGTSPSRNDLQAPSLVYDSGNSSPQTSLSSYTPSPGAGGDGHTSHAASKRRSTLGGPTKDPAPTAQPRPSPQLKSHASVSTFTPSVSTFTPSVSTATTVRQEHAPRMLPHSRSSPAIPTVGHLGGFYPPPVPMPYGGAPPPQLMTYGSYGLGMDFSPQYGGYAQYHPQQRAHHPSHHAATPVHYPSSSSRTRHSSNVR